MDIAEWWPRLTPSTREWLAANNGETVPPHLVAEIRAAGGVVLTDPWWIYHLGPTGFSLPDYETDWIEAVSNGEEPEPR